MFAGDFSDQWILKELSRCSMSIDNDIAHTVKSESRLEDGDLAIAEGERIVDDDDSTLIGDASLVRVVLAVPYVNVDHTKAVTVARIRSREPGQEHLYTLTKRSDQWTVVDDVLIGGE
jgi:hypothetical protein